MPSARLFYAAPFTGGIFSTSVKALNQRAHEKGSNRYELGGDIEGKFFSDTDASFLPGSQYRLKGDFNTSSYKFYGSFYNPEEQRSVNNVSGLFSFSNFVSKYFQSAVEINTALTSVPKEEFKQNEFNTNIFGKMVLENFTLTGNLGYKNSTLSDSAFNGIKTSYFSLLPRVGLDLTELFKLEVGFSFSNSASESYFNPYASLGLKLDRNFTIYAEYFPHAEFMGASSFLRKNPYLDLSLSRDLYIKYSTDISVGLKYEREKYFQINGGVSLKGSGNYPYFYSVPSIDSYKFAVFTTDTRMLTGFVDLLYHAGPFGYLYGKGEFNSSH